MLNYTFSEIIFIIMSVYCIKCTWNYLQNPEKVLVERDEVLNAFTWNKGLLSTYYLFVSAVTIMWGLSNCYSDFSLYSFLASQILNAVITQQLLNKTLLPREKHLYLSEIWSTLSWLLVAYEILVKQSLL